MNIKLITVCSHPENATALINSAKKHGWDITVIEVNPWRGFGTKLIETYNYLKAHPEVTNFVFADAFDVVALGTPEEFEAKLKQKHPDCDLVVSAEKGLWPPPLHPFRSIYPKFENGFNYINSGCYYSTRNAFISLLDKFPVQPDGDDQMWLNICWMVAEPGSIRMDCRQSLFNSHSFIGDGEYTYENNRVQIGLNEPIFIHFNGKTIDPIFNERIKI